MTFFIIPILIELTGEPKQNRLESFQALQTIRKDNIHPSIWANAIRILPKTFTDYFFEFSSPSSINIDIGWKDVSVVRPKICGRWVYTANRAELKRTFSFHLIVFRLILTLKYEAFLKTAMGLIHCK